MMINMGNLRFIIIIILLLGGVSCETDWAARDVEEKYCGSCIMTDNAGTWWLKTPDKDYVYVTPFEIYYRKYQLGDTIKCGKHEQ